MAFFSRTAARVTEALSTPGEPVQVAVRHIPFIETMWLRLGEAKEALAAKQAYLIEAGRMDIKMASLSALAEASARDETAVRHAEVSLERMKMLLAFGAEPTTPPGAWYCGRIEEPKKDVWGNYPSETWPARDSRDALVFQGAIPLIALRRYAATKGLVDDVRIYSPDWDDFRVLQNPQPRDPVMIGLINYLGDRVYFELARWDIDKDLVTVFGRV